MRVAGVALHVVDPLTLRRWIASERPHEIERDGLVVPHVHTWKGHSFSVRTGPGGWHGHDHAVTRGSAIGRLYADDAHFARRVRAAVDDGLLDRRELAQAVAVPVDRFRQLRYCTPTAADRVAAGVVRRFAPEALENEPWYLTGVGRLVDRTQPATSD